MEEGESVECGQPSDQWTDGLRQAEGGQPEPIMKRTSRTTRTVLWVACLTAAFVTTHLPPPAVPARPIINDKVLHFAGFVVLAVLTIWRIADHDRRIVAKTALFWLLVLVAYGIFDETTQPYFRRTFEWLDWAADIGGAATGVLITMLCHRHTVKTGDHRARV
jgi:VanZ family protein